MWVIEKIIIGHDNKEFGPGWFLGKVFIKNLTRDVQWRFNANRWLATDEDDCKTVVELKPSADSGQDGTKRGAGMGADVKIALIGTQGQTIDMLLDNDKDNFECGKVDHFLIDYLDVGDIQAVRIGHNDKGVGAGCFGCKTQEFCNSDFQFFVVELHQGVCGWIRPRVIKR